MIKSEVKITGTNLIVDKREAVGTISNWIRDYNSNLGAGIVDQLQFEQYFINSPNIKKLTPSEKEIVKSLFKLYEKLKISSMTPKGYEEKVLMKINGELKVWNDGLLEDINPEVKKAVGDLKRLGFFQEKNKKETLGANKTEAAGADVAENVLAELKQLSTRYQPGSLEKKVIDEEIEKMKHE